MDFSLPNKLTFLRILLSPVFFVLFIIDSPTTRLISLAVFLVAAITDWYDGLIARKRGIITELGKFLDPLADKVLTSAAFIAFAMCSLVPWWMVIIIVFRDLFVTALRSVAELHGWQFITTKFAQTKTFIQMAALYYLLVITVLRDSIPWNHTWSDMLATAVDPTMMYVIMFAVTVLTVVTGVQYVYECRDFLAGLFSHDASRR